MTNQEKTEVEVVELFVYPLKSCRGITMDSAELTPQGFPHDREFMVVGENGRMQTQRDIPLLSQIETQLDADHLVLSRTGYGSVAIPLAAPEVSADEEVIPVNVWKDETRTIPASDEASQWLTRAVESDKPLRVVRMAPGFKRAQRHPEDLGADTQVQFADAAPFLFVDVASLERLNEELLKKGEKAVPINRFRANAVIRGLEPFAEHQQIRLGSEHCSFDFRIPCERCVVPTIDQDTALLHPRKEPFNTLRDINPLDPKRRQPLFGQYAILHRGAGTRIALGDRLSAG